MTALGGSVSVVCPLFNEEATVDEFYKRATVAMQSIEPPVDYRLVFVDDGSTDGTGEALHRLAERDEHVSLVRFSRNFGHQVAVTAGIDHAPGDAVVVIDGDLQDPPEVIARMVDKWREGYDVVHGKRTARPGESRLRLLAIRLFYRLINWLSDVPLPVDTGDFRLMDRRVVDALKQLREDNRYVRGLVAWLGFEQTALVYERDVRYAGETKYPFRKLLRLATDGISSFSEKPLRLAAGLGMIVTALAFAFGGFIVVGKALNPSSALSGYASLMVVALFLGGVQLLTIGILGQYLGRTYRETKQRPLYVVAEQHNLDPPALRRTVQPDEAPSVYEEREPYPGDVGTPTTAFSS